MSDDNIVGEMPMGFNAFLANARANGVEVEVGTLGPERVKEQLRMSAEWSVKAGEQPSTAKAIWCLGHAAMHRRVAHTIAQSLTKGENA